MTFTWSETDLSTALARVRFAIGDTDADAALLSDEQIAAILELHPDERNAAVVCVRRILAKLARDIDVSGAGMSVSRSLKTQHFRDLLAELQEESDTGAIPILTGISISRDETLDADTDIRTAAFRVGRDDNPEAS